MNLQQLHEIQLNMMSAFHRFCEENGLIYYMVGGTLLGAAKYKGFIPWDDDVDLAMPRDSYERLQKFVDNLRGIGFILDSYRTNRNYPFPYTKLLYAKMPIADIIDIEYSFDTKVLIQFDVYPIDGIGASIKDAKKMIQKLKKWQILLEVRFLDASLFSPVKRFLIFAARNLPMHFLIRRLDRLMACSDPSKRAFVTRWRGPDYLRFVIPREFFDSLVLLDFEGRQFYAPERYEDYLTKVYGDYHLTPQLEDLQKMRHRFDRNHMGMYYYNDIIYRIKREL